MSVIFDAGTGEYRAALPGELGPFHQETPLPLPPPTLADWRVALDLMGRLQDVEAAVEAARNSADLQIRVLGSIAYQRLHYANHVYRADLMALRDELGFTEGEIDQSLTLAKNLPNL
jgi:hypothetical protein